LAPERVKRPWSQRRRPAARPIPAWCAVEEELHRAGQRISLRGVGLDDGRLGEGGGSPAADGDGGGGGLNSRDRPGELDCTDGTMRTSRLDRALTMAAETWPASEGRFRSNRVIGCTGFLRPHSSRHLSFAFAILRRLPHRPPQVMAARSDRGQANEKPTPSLPCARCCTPSPRSCSQSNP
jgi:hypothetical protein